MNIEAKILSEILDYQIQQQGWNGIHLRHAKAIQHENRSAYNTIFIERAGKDTVIAIDREKNDLKKIQHLFITRIVNTLGIEGNFFNMSEGTYEKPTTDIIHSGHRLNLPSQDQDTTEMTAFTTSIQHNPESPSQSK